MPNACGPMDAIYAERVFRPMETAHAERLWAHGHSLAENAHGPMDAIYAERL